MKGVRRYAVVLLGVAVGVTVAVFAHPQALGATAATPQPQASLFLSPSGNDAGRCTKAAPCVSWNRAYGFAAPGTVIEIAGGTYSGQVIEARSSLRNLTPGCTFQETAKCVVFRPASGATVLIQGSLEIRASSVWIRGLASPATGVPSRSRSYTIKVTGYVDTEADSESVYPDHVLVEGIDTTSFGIFNVDTATFRNMDVGPATIGASCRIVEGPGFENKIGFAGGVAVVPRNVVIDGLLIHNQNRNPDGAASDCHFGGLFLATANGLIVRNSVFSQNAVYNVQVQNFSGAPPASNIVFENNIFGCPVGWLYDPGGEGRCVGQADIQFNASSAFTNWLIRFNSFGGGIGQYVDDASYTNVRVIGNAGSRPSRCFSGMTFSYNAWVGGSCAGTDRRIGTFPFVSTAPGSEDFRLARPSSAAAFVAPVKGDLGIATDIEGRVRPLRYPRDAGAFQRDTSFLALGRSIGSAVMDMPRAALLERYGTPRKSRSRRLGLQKVAGVTESFPVTGGFLNATLVNDRVVGLATRSAYYTTPKGVGVGSPVTSVPSRAWDTCKKTLRRKVHGVVVSFQVSGGKKPRIVEVSMLRRAYDVPCTEES